MAALTLADLPAEAVESLVTEAEADAVRAAEFLALVGLGPPANGTRVLPGDFLLNLGSALRLLAWEASGIRIHREAGLPAAADAVRQVFSAAAARGRKEPPDLRLYRTVRRLAADRIAWAAPRDLRAEVVLQVADEDQFVEALAQFLWKHRHRPCTAAEGPED